LVFVEDVKRLVPRYLGLEQAKAVRVDRADEQTPEPIHDCWADSLFGSHSDAVPKFGRRPFGEGERNDGRRRHAGGEQFGHPLRDDLSLSRPGCRDDLHVAATVLDCGKSAAFKDWRCHALDARQAGGLAG
jgi:hypothetical protein